jgi:DNA-binding transcriptional MerR regulator
MRGDTHRPFSFIQFLFQQTAMADSPLEKRYYTIGEVADMFGVSKSLVRFWENEFDALRPHKNSKGDRRFTAQNIEVFRQIHVLVKERGFTLDGAKQELKKHQIYQREKEAVLQKLMALRQALLNIRDSQQG